MTAVQDSRYDLRGLGNHSLPSDLSKRRKIISDLSGRLFLDDLEGEEVDVHRFENSDNVIAWVREGGEVRKTIALFFDFRDFDSRNVSSGIQLSDYLKDNLDRYIHGDMIIRHQDVEGFSAFYWTREGLKW